MRYDALTFGLAFFAFVLLAADAALRWRAVRRALLTRTAAGVALAHVACVWTLRFDLSLPEMWRKSPAAFVLFHAALLVLLAAAVIRDPARDRLVWAAFAIVCAGALPAPFRYDEIAVLRVPVLAVAAAAICVAQPWRRRAAA